MEAVEDLEEDFVRLQAEVEKEKEDGKKKIAELNVVEEEEGSKSTSASLVDKAIERPRSPKTRRKMLLKALMGVGIGAAVRMKKLADAKYRREFNQQIVRLKGSSSHYSRLIRSMRQKHMMRLDVSVGKPLKEAMVVSTHTCALRLYTCILLLSLRASTLNKHFPRPIMKSPVQLHA